MESFAPNYTDTTNKKTFLKSISCVLMFLLSISTSSLSIAATFQQTHRISGTVQDSNLEPLSLVTVKLTRENENRELIQTTLTDDKGSFTFEAVVSGDYKIELSSMGYTSKESNTLKLNSKSQHTVLEPLIMIEESTNLEAVAITAERPLVERRADMMVVNVENSSIAAGNSALEILERSPGVTVDKDDNISLLGKQGVQVMINGKATNLSSSQLADLLRSTDGNTVKSVELITNPSSKYEASGTAGIINIVLKKNKMQGTNGSVNLSAGYGYRLKSSNSINLNHKTGAFNLYGTFSYLNNKGEQTLNIDRNILNQGVNTFFGQNSFFERQTQNYSYLGGVDYQTSERNTLTLEINGFNNANSSENPSITRIGRQENQLDSTLNSLASSTSKFNYVGFNLNNQFNLDSNGRQLTAQVDVSQFYKTSFTDYSNHFLLPNGDLLKDPDFSKSNAPTIIDIQVAKLDYTHPLENGSKIETGFRYSQVESDNEIRFDVLKQDNWELDNNRSNRFIYDEKIAAAYLTYKQEFKKISMQLGLRAEYTASTGHSPTLDSINKKDYLNLFPTAFLSYTLTDKQTIGLSYSKRINRPSYTRLNPFTYYFDPFTLEQGNPNLSPEFAHVFEGSYSLNNKYHLTVGASFTNDAIVETMIQDDEKKTTAVTYDNLAKMTMYYANLNFPVKITNFWSTNTSINAYYADFKGNLNQDELRRGKPAANIRNSHNFTIFNDFKVEAVLNYNSHFVYGIYNVEEQYGLDLGISKSILNKKGSLKLGVSDLFKTRQHLVNSYHGSLNLRVNQDNETRVARLTFTYSFGNLKNSNRQSSAIDEKNRARN